MKREIYQVWYLNAQKDLKNVLKNEIRKHIMKLKKKYPDLYGYAILPGESYEVNTLVVVYNRVSDIKEEAAYFRYSIDEWENWDHNALASINSQIKEINDNFRSWHPDNSKNISLDIIEQYHISSLHEIILSALKDLVEEDLFDFGIQERFIAIWISDSDSEIKVRSIRELNTEKVIKEYLEEFEE